MRAKTAYVFYHSSDLDGKAGCEIYKRYFKSAGYDIVETVGWTHGLQEPDFNDIDPGSAVGIVDISFCPDTMVKLYNRHVSGNISVSWVDHHISAIRLSKEYGYDKLPGSRGIGVAACELACHLLLNKVSLMVQYLSTYDVWDKERFNWDEVMAFQYGARSMEREVLNRMFKDNEAFMTEVIEKGKSILKYEKDRMARYATSRAFEAQVAGHKVIALNTGDFCSLAFESVYKPEEHNMMMPFSMLRPGVWQCSLYTTHDFLDVSEVCMKFGGGGHAQTGGFQLTEFEIMELFTKQTLTPKK